MLASSSASAQNARDAVEWRDEWTPVRPVEAIGTVGLTLLSLFLVPELDGPHRRDFRGGIGFLDNGARSLLRARSPSVQEVTAEYSDLGFRALALFPESREARKGLEQRPERSSGGRLAAAATSLVAPPAAAARSG